MAGIRRPPSGFHPPAPRSRTVTDMLIIAPEVESSNSLTPDVLAVPDFARDRRPEAVKTDFDLRHYPNSARAEDFDITEPDWDDIQATAHYDRCALAALPEQPEIPGLWG